MLKRGYAMQEGKKGFLCFLRDIWGGIDGEGAGLGRLDLAGWKYVGCGVLGYDDGRGSAFSCGGSRCGGFDQGWRYDIHLVGCLSFFSGLKVLLITAFVRF